MRAAAQLLHRPVSMRDPVDLARAIAGAQAQDVYAGPLTFRSRSRTITAADVEKARTEERSLLRTWVMRMTIHLIPSDDAGWMLPLFEPLIEKWSRRRLAQLGMSADDVSKALRVAKRTLEREGPVTRPQLRERIADAGVALDTQTGLHVIGLAVTSGLACLGPDRGRTSCLVLRQDWLGKPSRLDRDAALAELARRYLGAFGPATERDFAKWSGLPLRELRAGLGRIASELTETRVGDQALLSLKRGRRRAAPPGQLRMLGAFDTYMLGYANRDFALPHEHLGHLKAGGGGWLRPILVRDGAVVGGWHYSRRGGRIEVALESPKPRSSELRKAIDSEIADLSRFEGMPVTLAGERGG
jgi:Winged helix DNA-binding domain